MWYMLYMKHPKLTASAARADFARLVTRVFGGERVVIERAGGVAVAMVPVDDLALLEDLEDRMDVEAARAALAEPGANIPWTKLKAKHGL